VALQRLDDVTFLETENEELFAYVKRSDGNTVLVVVNLDPRAPREGVCVVPASTGVPPVYRVRDLLAGETWTWHVGRNYVKLGPGKSHVLLVVRDA
jgi:starch synthase (maltosyl-transferring)